MALLRGKLFDGVLFNGGLLGGQQVAPPVVQPQYQRAGGGGRKRGRRVLIQPGDPIQIELFPLVPQHENIIPLIQPATPARTRLQRRREEEILLAA